GAAGRIGWALRATAPAGGRITPAMNGHRARRPAILTTSGAARRGGEHDDVQFEVKPDSGGNYSWWLSSSNGQTVAWAGESFASKSNANRAAEAFKAGADRKSTRLNSSHVKISYAVFCLKKKNKAE